MRRESDLKTIGLGTRIMTQDLRGTPIDTNTNPEKNTRETEEEKEVVQIRYMIKEVHKRDTTQKNMKTRRESNKKVITEMSIRSLDQEKTQEADTERGLEIDRVKEDRGIEV